MKYVKILVTGGAGFIGSHVASHLIKEHHNVSIIDNFHTYYSPQRKKKQLEQIQAVGPYNMYAQDLLNEEGCKGIFMRHSFDAVIHLAALPGVTYSIQQPDQYMDINLKGTLNVLKWAGQTGVKHVIFASSSSVYGDQEGQPLSEDMANNRVVSPYAASKGGAEALCHAYQNLYGFQLSILRFFTVYGPWGRPDMAITTFIRKLLNGEAIDVFGKESARDYTYIDDIVRGIHAALYSSSDHGIYNLGSGRPVSMSTLLEHLKRHFPHMCINEKPWRSGDVKMTSADISKAKEVLGYQPAVSFADGLAQTIKWAEKERENL
jgi:UDP-glucuronate 4-epimerase